MKVKDLIELLQTFDLEKEVLVGGNGLIAEVTGVSEDKQGNVVINE